MTYYQQACAIVAAKASQTLAADTVNCKRFIKAAEQTKALLLNGLTAQILAAQDAGVVLYKNGQTLLWTMQFTSHSKGCDVIAGISVARASRGASVTEIAAVLAADHMRRKGLTF